MFGSHFHLTEPVLIALIAAVPSTIGALTLRQTRANRRELETRGDGTAGDHIANIATAVSIQGQSLAEIRRELLGHIDTAEPELIRQGKELAVLQATVNAHLAEDQDSFAAVREDVKALMERLT